MARIIQSKRDTSNGDNYFYCPESGQACYNGFMNNKCEKRGCTFEQLPARFRVHCKLEGSGLIEFEPPKAHDSVGGFKGIDVVKSRAHRWAEPKLDGARALVHITPDGVFITSRRRNKDGEYNQFGENVPHILQILAPLKSQGYTILDGEICMEADWRNGESNLGLTMGVVGAKPDKAIALQKQRGLAKLMLFDAPRVMGNDLSSLPLENRRKALETVIGELEDQVAEMRDLTNRPVQPVPYRKFYDADDVLTYFTQVTDQQGLEGLVLKDPDSNYFASRGWLKLKPHVTIDAQIIGFDWGATGGKYQDTVGALRTAVYGPDHVLTEVCTVSPGDDATRDYWLKMLNGKNPQQIHDLNAIVEVEGQGWSKDLRIRHPRVVKYRADLSEPQVVDFTEVKRI